jgi:hypothetical protein
MNKANPHSTPLTRRAILRATAASATIMAPAVAMAALPRAAPTEPLLALEAKWRASIADTNEAGRQWSAIHDTLPEHAQGGWPRIPTSSPLFDGPHAVVLGRPGTAISLTELRKINSKIEKFERTVGASPERIAEVRAEGRARVRWWIETYRDGNRISAESGFDAAGDHCEVVGAKLIEFQNQILKARAVTIDGVRIKLAVLLHMATINGYTDFYGNVVKPLEDWDYTDRALFNLHLDAERLAGGAA